MRALLFVGTGGFIGSVLRYLISQFMMARTFSDFPWATFIVNVVGCFIIGLLFSFSEKGNLAADWRLFLATGLCGGFTTFSAFSNETIALLRGGQTLYAFTYIGASVIVGLLAAYAGIMLVKAV